MIVYFVRHTTPDIEKGICYGQSDIGLASDFESESDFLLSKIKDIPKQTIISSPLKRCMTLAYKMNINAISNPLLMELNFGDWELKPWNEIPQVEQDVWMQDYVNVPPTNGESYTELYGRTLLFYHSIKQNNTIIVTHSGVIRSILAYTTNTNLKDSFKFKIPYGTIVKINTETHEYEIL